MIYECRMTVYECLMTVYECLIMIFGVPRMVYRHGKKKKSANYANVREWRRNNERPFASIRGPLSKIIATPTVYGFPRMIFLGLIKIFPCWKRIFGVPRVIFGCLTTFLPCCTMIYEHWRAIFQ
jgi:hypothetical protein